MLNYAMPFFEISMIEFFIENLFEELIIDARTLSQSHAVVSCFCLLVSPYLIITITKFNLHRTS